MALMIIYFLLFFICVNASNPPGAPFFPGKFKFELPKQAKTSEIPGRYDSAHLETSDLPLLQECIDLNHFLSRTESIERKRSKTQNFIKKLKSRFSEASKSIFENTIGHFHCVHALASCKFEDLGNDFVARLFMEHTRVAKKFMVHFSQLTDYSFLTVEKVEILFADKNVVLRPFALKSLVETVNLDVIARLIEIFDYELRDNEIKNVLSSWGEREDFVGQVGKDPRSWLLFRKTRPFPMDSVIENLLADTKNVQKYANILLAWILQNEQMINLSMRSLEYINADLHKNDPIEERSMKPEMIKELNSWKWDLWRENGKSEFETIREQMELKFRLISALKRIKGDAERPATDLNTATVLDLLDILAAPLNSLARSTYIKSRDENSVIEAIDKFTFNYSSEYTAHVKLDQLFNENYWIILWKQLELLKIDLSYQEDTFLDVNSLLKAIRFIYRRTKTISLHPSPFWYTQMIISLVKSSELAMNLDGSKLVVEILDEFSKNDICQLQQNHFVLLRASLHPGTFAPPPSSNDNDDVFLYFEIQNYSLDAFKFAPEILSTDEISSLLRNPIIKAVMLKFHPGSAFKLRSLKGFTLENLQEFFPNGILETSEALYTVDPLLVAEYFKGEMINRPEKFVWSVHPDCWKEQKFLDFIADVVPFAVLFKYPDDCEALNIPFVITDIVGRLSRIGNDHRQKMIIKWIVYMEWLFFQYLNYSSSEGSEGKGTSSRHYNPILVNESRARSQLIKWLKTNNSSLQDGELILNLVERTPLSYARAADIYIHHMTKILKISDKAVPEFEVFKEKPIYQIKLRELEGQVSESRRVCEFLMEKFFDDAVERPVWMNRLTIVNIPGISRHLLNPIRTDYITNLFQNNAAPFEDLQTTGAMLLRCGYYFRAGCDNTGEFLKPSGTVLKAQEKNVNVAEMICEKAKGMWIGVEVKLRREGQK